MHLREMACLLELLSTLRNGQFPCQLPTVLFDQKFLVDGFAIAASSGDPGTRLAIAVRPAKNARHARLVVAPDHLSLRYPFGQPTLGRHRRCSRLNVVRRVSRCASLDKVEMFLALGNGKQLGLLAVATDRE